MQPERTWKCLLISSIFVSLSLSLSIVRHDCTTARILTPMWCTCTKGSTAGITSTIVFWFKIVETSWILSAAPVIICVSYALPGRSTLIRYWQRLHSSQSSAMGPIRFQDVFSDGSWGAYYSVYLESLAPNDQSQMVKLWLFRWDGGFPMCFSTPRGLLLHKAMRCEAGLFASDAVKTAQDLSSNLNSFLVTQWQVICAHTENIWLQILVIRWQLLYNILIWTRPAFVEFCRIRWYVRAKR